MFGEEQAEELDDYSITNDFIKKLSVLKAEGIKHKSNKQLSNVWSDEDDELIEQLNDLILLAKDSGVEIAEREFKEECPLYGKASFLEYLLQKPSNSGKNLDILRATNKAGDKAKVNRATSKINRCRLCDSATKIDGNKIVCTNKLCRFSEDIATKNSRLKTSVMKHTRNKVDMLLGLKTPPKKIIELLPMIQIWLTDLTYLYDWLAYKEATFISDKCANLKENWIEKFAMIYQPRDPGMMWEMQIKREPKYAWSYSEYKILITEFHSMIEECERLGHNQFTQSNVESLYADAKIEICKDFYEKFNRLPEVGETYVYNDEKYDIGNYINKLALTCDTSDIKHKLDEIFHTNIHMPGLMDSYIKLTLKKKADRFALTESYSYLIHKIFKIPYVNVEPTDVEKIIDIIQEFDNYVQRTTSVAGHKLN